MKKSLKIFLVFLVSVIGAGALLFSFLFYVNVFVIRPPKFENRKYANLLHTIEKGENFIKVANDLKEKDLVHSSFWLKTYFLLSGRWDSIKAGIYDLPYGSSTAQLAGIISRGEIKKAKITILEGWTLKDIAKQCEEKGLFSQEEFFNSAKKFTLPKEESGFDNMALVKKAIENYNAFLSTSTENFLATTSFIGLDLEGYMFPDTYEIIYPFTPEKLIRQALANFEKKITPDLQAGNFRETIIMASLLEKEVPSYKDKRIVAGIFWKRLKEGWLLQICSTVNYALGKVGEKTYLEGLETDSLYNTYIYKGLPPGPICNPGLESIKAAVYFENSPYWYYLSAKKDGRTIFSQTFDRHVAAKQKYLR